MTSIISLKRLLSRALSVTLAVALLLPTYIISTSNDANAYTLSGPRYATPPERSKSAEEKLAPTAEVAAEEDAELKEFKRMQMLQQKMMAQLQPNQEVINHEIKDVQDKGGMPLLIYGSPKLDKFLGCLNCHPRYTISVWNKKGPFGSEYGDYSIWNGYHEFGNIISSLSPWTRYSRNPPAIVDSKAKFYGFLTINPNIEKHFTNNFTKTLYYDYYDISENPQAWFEKTFAKQLEANEAAIALNDLEGMPEPTPTEDSLLPPDVEVKKRPGLNEERQALYLPPQSRY